MTEDHIVFEEGDTVTPVKQGTLETCKQWIKDSYTEGDRRTFIVAQVVPIARVELDLKVTTLA